MPVTPQEVRADWRNASPFLAILVKPITALIIISRVGKMRCEEQGYEPTIRPTHRLCHSECNNRLGACRSLRRPITQLRQAAQLDHEPTPESVGQAQTYAQLSFAAELAQAEAQDALGYEPDCLLAARRAKQVLELP